MSIPFSTISNARAVAPPGLDDDKPGNRVKEEDTSNKVKDVDSPASAVAKAKADLNSAIVQTSMNVAINAGNEPLTLLLKSAINGINEALQPTLGKDAIQTAAGSQDNSPEATAERIVSLSTAFYDNFREKNGLEDNAQSREQFVGVIREGFEKGFKEAQDVLEGLKVLGGEVAAGIDKTFELVMKGFDAFMAVPKPEPDVPETDVAFPPVADPLQ